MATVLDDPKRPAISDRMSQHWMLARAVQYIERSGLTLGEIEREAAKSNLRVSRGAMQRWVDGKTKRCLISTLEAALASVGVALKFNAPLPRKPRGQAE